MRYAMNKLVYQAAKVTAATLLAVLIAEVLHLHYSTTAGIIAMLSVLDTRKQSLIVGVKRLSAASIAVVMAILLFNAFGHHLWVLGVFLMIFIPLLTLLKSTEALTIGTVLVTHIYAINTADTSIFINELALLAIGVTVGWLLNLHMLGIEEEIRQCQVETESAIKELLNKMKLQLLNQCSVKEQENALEDLDRLISAGMSSAIKYNDNYILKDYGYFEKYFAMRRQQYFVLKHMENHFKHMYVAVDEAIPLSEFTALLSETLNECNDGMALLKALKALRHHYKETPLPKTRDEFENRATLFQYLNDLDYFIRIKSAFMVVHGEIHYCISNSPSRR